MSYRVSWALFFIQSVYLWNKRMCHHLRMNNSGFNRSTFILRIRHLDRQLYVRPGLYGPQKWELETQSATFERISGRCVLAEPIWRRVLSAGLVCWASWRSCGGGSAWRTRSWPSRCQSEGTSPPCCSSKTTARYVLWPRAHYYIHCAVSLGFLSSSLLSSIH